MTHQMQREDAGRTARRYQRLGSSTQRDDGRSLRASGFSARLRHASRWDDGRVTADLSQWAGVARPERTVLDGRYARLEPLTVERHEETLFESARQPGAEARFAYLFDDVPADLAAFHRWMERG